MRQTDARGPDQVRRRCPVISDSRARFRISSTRRHVFPRGSGGFQGNDTEADGYFYASGQVPTCQHPQAPNPYLDEPDMDSGCGSSIAIDVDYDSNNKHDALSFRNKLVCQDAEDNLLVAEDEHTTDALEAVRCSQYDEPVESVMTNPRCLGLTNATQPPRGVQCGSVGQRSSVALDDSYGGGYTVRNDGGRSYKFRFCCQGRGDTPMRYLGIGCDTRKIIGGVPSAIRTEDGCEYAVEETDGSHNYPPCRGLVLWPPSRQQDPTGRCSRDCHTFTLESADDSNSWQFFYRDREDDAEARLDECHMLELGPFDCKKRATPGGGCCSLNPLAQGCLPAGYGEVATVAASTAPAPTQLRTGTPQNIPQNTASEDDEDEPEETTEDATSTSPSQDSLPPAASTEPPPTFDVALALSPNTSSADLLEPPRREPFLPKCSRPGFRYPECSTGVCLDNIAGLALWCVPKQPGNLGTDYVLRKIPITALTLPDAVRPNTSSPLGYRLDCDCQRILVPCAEDCSKRPRECVCSFTNGTCVSNEKCQATPVAGSEQHCQACPIDSNGRVCSGHGACRCDGTCDCIRDERGPYVGSNCDTQQRPPSCADYKDCETCQLNAEFQCSWCSTSESCLEPTEECSGGGVSDCKVLRGLAVSFVTSSCPNNCSGDRGQGICIRDAQTNTSICVCSEGFHGIDCAAPGGVKYVAILGQNTDCTQRGRPGWRYRRRSCCGRCRCGSGPAGVHRLVSKEGR
jgi:hypothetical protein